MKGVSRKDQRGSGLLEAGAGIALCLTLIVSTFGTLDAMYRSFDLGKTVDDALTSFNEKPLVINVTTDGHVTFTTNEERLNSFVREAFDSLRAHLSEESFPHYVEVEYAEVPIDEVTGAPNGPLRSYTNSRREDGESLGRRDENLSTLFTKSLLRRADDGSSIYAIKEGFFDDGNNQVKFIPKVILVGARASVDLGDSLSGYVWKMFTGESVITTRKVLSLRSSLG